VPGASTGQLFKAVDVATEYPILAEYAARDIDGFIGFGTATPVTDATVANQLKQVEALLVVHSRASAVYAARDQENGEPYRAGFRIRAMGLLDNIIFPATATAPAKDPGFSAADRTLVVATFNDYTTPGRWLVICQTAGGEDVAVLGVWDARADNWSSWPLSDGLTWPTTQAAADPRGALQHQLLLTVAGTGDFKVGDTWRFRTFGKWKKKGMHRGVRMVDTRRRGSTGTRGGL